MSPPPRILYCHCAYAQALPEAAKRRVLEALCASGAEFEAVPDLCEMSARRDPSLRALAEGGCARIAACYPRAVRGLFAAADVPLRDGVSILNMRENDPERICAAVLDGIEKRRER